MSFTTLDLSYPCPGIARVRLTREREMNTLSLPLIEELNLAIDEVLAARSRVLVSQIDGNGYPVPHELDAARLGQGHLGRAMNGHARRHAVDQRGHPQILNEQGIDPRRRGRLDEADGLERPTLCKLSLIQVVEAGELHLRRGRVCAERQRQMGAQLIRLYGLWLG